MAKKINCPNCHLSIDDTNKKCPFCDAKIEAENVEVVEEEDTASTPKKKKMHKYTMCYLIAAGIALLSFFVMFIPAFGSDIDAISASSLYGLAFGFTLEGVKYASVRGATIIFVLELVGILNFAAVLWSVRKKTAEISLFSYFTAFYYAFIVVVSVVTMAGGFNDNEDYALKPGAGIIIVLLLALAAIAMTIVGVVLYTKHQKKKGVRN